MPHTICKHTKQQHHVKATAAVTYQRNNGTFKLTTTNLLSLFEQNFTQNLNVGNVFLPFYFFNDRATKPESNAIK